MQLRSKYGLNNFDTFCSIGEQICSLDPDASALNQVTSRTPTLEECVVNVHNQYISDHQVRTLLPCQFLVNILLRTSRSNSNNYQVNLDVVSEQSETNERSTLPDTSAPVCHACSF